MTTRTELLQSEFLLEAMQQYTVVVSFEKKELVTCFLIDINNPEYELNIQDFKHSELIDLNLSEIDIVWYLKQANGIVVKKQFTVAELYDCVKQADMKIPRISIEESEEIE